MQCGYIFSDFIVPSDNDIYKLKSLSFIIKSEEYGGIIFDTGSSFNPNDVLEQLKNNFDLSPEDIKFVFITHFHPDHLGANRFFRKAKFIFSEKELNFQSNAAEVVFANEDLFKFLYDNCPGYRNTFTKKDAENMNYYIRRFWSRENLGLNYCYSFIESNPDIPDFIEPVESFGHTHNHYAYKIKSDKLNYFVTGDSVSNRLILKPHFSDSFKDAHADLDKYIESRDFFKKQSGVIIPGHDRPFNIDDCKAVKNKFWEI